MNTVGMFEYEGRDFKLRHGSVVIAAITSCTNTSNPSVMLGAGNEICHYRCTLIRNYYSRKQLMSLLITIYNLIYSPIVY